MTTADNGAIDYRRRLRERKSLQAEATVATAASVVTDATYDPPQEYVEVITAEAAIAVTGATTVNEPAAVVETAAPEPSPSRTPQAVREQAKAAMTQLLSVTDAEYTAMMTELSTADPILYAAVVDEINDARMAATTTV